MLKIVAALFAVLWLAGAAHIAVEGAVAWERRGSFAARPSAPETLTCRTPVGTLRCQDVDLILKRQIDV